MSLADDVRVLRLFAEGKGVSDVYGALRRVLPLLTKLGELSPEQARAVAHCLTFNARFANNTNALRTAAEVFKMLGGGT